MALASCVLFSACVLPISTAKTQSAEPLGQGRFGGGITFEVPNVNLTGKSVNTTGSESDTAIANTYSFRYDYGATDRLDLSFNADLGAVFGFVFSHDRCRNGRQIHLV